jgi:hypothetical protein
VKVDGPIGPGVRVQVVGASNAMGTEWWSLEQQPVSYYREAVARARRLRAKPWCQKRWYTRRGNRTMPRYSPISTACRLAFQQGPRGASLYAVGSR